MKGWIPLTITGVVAILFLLWYFDPKGRFTEKVDSRDTTVINLPPVSISIPPSSAPSIIYQPIPANVDSLAIVRDYFAMRSYADSSENDTVKVMVYEKVGQNKIIDRRLDWKLKIPITTVIEQHTASRRMLLIGGSVYRDSLTTGLYFNAAYKNKRDWMFIGGYDPFTKTGMGGVLMPIKLRTD